MTLTEGRSYLFLGAAQPLKPETAAGGRTAECFGDSVQFSWSKVPEARTYTLQLVGSTRETTRAIEQVTGIRSTEYTLKRMLEPGMRYSYRVRPVSSDGTPGPWSAAAPLDGQLAWKLVTTSPAFKRYDTHGAAGIVFRDEMWLIGGLSSGDGMAFHRRCELGGCRPARAIRLPGQLWVGCIQGPDVVNRWSRSSNRIQRRLELIRRNDMETGDTLGSIQSSNGCRMCCLQGSNTDDLRK